MQGEPSMKRRQFLTSAGIGLGAAASGVAMPAIAQSNPEIRWRMTSGFPKSLDTLFGVSESFSRRIAEATEGRWQIQPFAAGEIVGTFQAFDAIANGTVEMGHTSAYYYLGKDPTFAAITSLPFGPNARQLTAWQYQGGGNELCNEYLHRFNVHASPAGNTGAQMGGWFRREIRSVPDLQGLKFRVAGIGGIALQRLGVTPQLLPGGGIYTALTSGEVDAAEWVGPYDDEKLGLNRAAQFYYYPGWWEWAPSFDLMVNLRAWERLPDHYKAVLEAAGAEGWHWMMQRYDAQNPPAARRLIASGTQLRVFPQEVMRACYNACQDLYAELGERNARFKQIHEGWDRFRRETQAWFGIAEDSLSNFLVTESQQRR